MIFNSFSANLRKGPWSIKCYHCAIEVVNFTWPQPSNNSAHSANRYSVLHGRQIWTQVTTSFPYYISEFAHFRREMLENSSVLVSLLNSVLTRRRVTNSNQHWPCVLTLKTEARNLETDVSERIAAPGLPPDPKQRSHAQIGCSGPQAATALR